ncbi:ribokinase [Bacteroidota bacterium]
MSNKIVVVGSSNVDLIVKSDKIPKLGETVLGGTFYKAAGGKGANQAVAASRAGGDVSFISCVGDEYGEESIEGFRKDGINVDHVKKDPDVATGIALILVDKNGENSISVASGANLSLSVSDIQNAQHIIADAEVLLMQLEISMDVVEEAAIIAAAADVKTILNPAPAQALSDELLKSVSILTPNESETEILTGMPVKNESDARKAAALLHKKGVDVVIITIGSKGALLSSGEETKIISGHIVEAKDTTAAGDVFNGALAVAIAEKKSLDEAIRFANAAAAVSVTRMGAQPSVPFRDEIDDMLKASM